MYEYDVPSPQFTRIALFNDGDLPGSTNLDVSTLIIHHLSVA